ncbi:thiol-disulfide oxidoreductase DCC family protein [Virgibacillus alimentarius]|uniref:DCC family thiol-disulfide oxidoreductase YuxK n=1 Tax=Virgibacillus alimentarius TaxID=698769 RepID=A0ABS4S658_9BACI|nr:DCC1-like thiol-disulfide oxidoreductase family protein [Virgibacillus alimentarius]MBP2256967.1 putative DCC family thiol-disulfide oxidoreductase YuxK [Virgibacillus alimentarius]
MIVYYDGNCMMCTNTSKLLNKMDIRNKLTFTSFRKIEDYPKAMKESLHVYYKHIIFQGYDAFIQIAKVLPIMWIFLPLMYIFKWLGLGEFIYKKVAASRKIIPVNQCETNCSLSDRTKQ